MSTNPLSAEDAQTALVFGVRPFSKLKAIASGEHVVIERMTEAEAREKFDAWLKTNARDLGLQVMRDDDYMRGRAQTVWLAALRSIGAVKH